MRFVRVFLCMFSLSLISPLVNVRAHTGFVQPQLGATAVSGEIKVDTIWSGDVLVTDTVVVQPDVTLTLLPGTRV